MTRFSVFLSILAIVPWSIQSFATTTTRGPLRSSRTLVRAHPHPYPHPNPRQHSSRRNWLVSATGGLTAATLTSQNVWAADKSVVPQILLAPQASSAQLENGLLESRLQGNVLSPPPYGMEGPDIFYPEWFMGTWNAVSETKEIQAPCGVALFGGNATYQNALNDVNNILRYESRFLVDANGRIIADREYNVKSIARVALGENSVVNVATATPNKFSCLLAPKGSPSMIRVDLIVLNRRQEPISANQFDCSEVVREIASRVDQPKQQAPTILKEIETVSMYTYLPEKDQVQCRQRSASFLLPSNENPMAMRMWQASGGRAIDVRFYDVTYTRTK